MTKKPLFKTMMLMTVAATVVLAGCSNSNNNAKSDNTSGSAANNTASGNTNDTKEASQDPVTIKYSTFRPEDETAMKALIAKFEGANPLIKVDYETQKDAAAYYQTLKANVLAGDSVDVFDMHPSSDFVNFVNEGYLADLSDLSFNANYSDSAQKVSGRDGKNYGYLTSVNMIMLFYNKQILQDNGVAVPTDYSSLVQSVNALKAKGLGGIAYPGADVGGVWLGHALMNESAGSDDYAALLGGIDKGEKTTIKDDAGIYQGLKSLAQVNKDKLLYDNSASVKYPQTLQLFAQKKAPFMMMGTWTFGTADTDFPGIDYGILPFPTLDKADTAYAEPAQITVAFAKSKHLEQAKAFIDFLAQPENASAFTSQIKQTSTIKGVKADFAGADLLAAQMEKGMVVLPVVTATHTDKWETQKNDMLKNILFKSGDADKEIASYEKYLGKLDLKNNQ